MSGAAEVLSYASALVFAVLAALCLVRWRRLRIPGAGWVAAGFSALAVVALQGLLLPEDARGALVLLEKVSVALLLFFPYFLYRFTASFDRPSRALEIVALGLSVFVAGLALFVPLPAEGELGTAPAQGFILAVLVEWTVLSIVSAVRLWRAGRDEPTPGRRRLRLLSGASLVLNATIVLAGTESADGSEATGIVVQLLALGAVSLFAVALFPPALLRRAWRGPEEAEFRQAIGELMAATQPKEVVACLLPHIGIVGGRDAAVVDEDGRVLGGSDETARAWLDGRSDNATSKEGDRSAPGLIHLPIHAGSLLVRPSKYTSFLGRDELELLETLAAMADLALRRVEAERTIYDQAQLLDLAPDAIIVRDLDGRITYWNEGAEQQYGYSKDEVLGRIIYELLATKYPAPQSEIEALALQDGRWEGELIQTRRDGSEITVASRWAVRTDTEGRPFQILLINNDITEQKAAAREVQAAKDEAERANRAKSEFLSRMSHELRTPMNAILGFGQLLEMRDLGAEERDHVGEIRKAGDHLLGLINEVLEISRIEAGKLAISLEPVPLHDLLAESLSLIRPLAEQRGLSLGYEEAGCEGKHVLGDLQRLKQVLLNLLSNAVKYNVEGGSVHVRCDPRPEENLRISVSDTGRGIPPDRLGQLFEPFERLGAEQEGQEGTGLGLALSKRLVEAMGGSIGVDPAQGKGSTFWIDLQEAQDPADGAEVGEAARPATKDPSRPRRTALYIEDNLSNLKLIQRILARRPEIKVIAAMRGRLGIDLAREHQPDVILLDLQLPDMSGSDVLRALKAEGATRHIPVIVISADATQSQVRDLMAEGAHAYLTKPLDIQQFLSVLDEESIR